MYAYLQQYDIVFHDKMCSFDLIWVMNKNIYHLHARHALFGSNNLILRNHLNHNSS